MFVYSYRPGNELMDYNSDCEVIWFLREPKRLYSDRKRGSPYSFQIQKMQSCRMVTHTMVAH